MNTWAVTGRLGRDPVLRSLSTGLVINFSIAVSHRAKKDGEWVDAPIWTEVSYFGVRAQWLHDHLQKGTLIEAVGELSVRTYEGRDGQTRTQIELNARHVAPLDKFERREGTASASSASASSSYRPQHRDGLSGNRSDAGQSYFGEDDNIPF